MVTFQPGRVVLIAVFAALTVSCSREQQDWRSAEAADSSEAYARFLEQHPDSELAVQARARVEQLSEQRDWTAATRAATADAYRAFLAQHPSGRWSEEARIRIEAFSLGSAPHLASPSSGAGIASPASSGVRALQLATATNPPPPVRGSQPQPSVALLRAQPQEAQPSAGKTNSSSGGAYGVQLGAFGSEASAGREWRRLQGRFGAQLGGLEPRIVPAGSNSGQLYRLQAPAAGEAQARALCASLNEQAQPCVPVLPSR